MNNNNISGYDPNTGQPIYNNTQQNQPTKKKSNPIVITLAVIGGIIVSFIILFIVNLTTAANSKKLVCTSPQGNITIMYNDKNLTGYKAVGVSYNLHQQGKIANQIGTEKYIAEFKTWFKTNTTGTCHTK